MLDLPFRRVPFTPDLLPADLTGTQIYRPFTGEFDIRLGPIVTGVLARRRNQLRSSKVQSCAFGSDARRPSHDRRSHDPVAEPVLRPGHPKSDRARGDLSASRGSTRSLLDEIARRLSRTRRRVGDARLAERLGHRSRRSAPSFRRGGDLGLTAKASAVRVAASIKEYVVDLIRATRDPSAFGLATSRL